MSLRILHNQTIARSIVWYLVSQGKIRILAQIFFNSLLWYSFENINKGKTCNIWLYKILEKSNITKTKNTLKYHERTKKVNVLHLIFLHLCNQIMPYCNAICWVYEYFDRIINSQYIISPLGGSCYLTKHQIWCQR